MRNQEAPYQSPLLDQVLHATLRGLKEIRYSESDNALKDVALVGMLLPDTEAVRNGQVTANDIYGADSAMLTRSFNALSRAGINLHPEASFQIYNILPPVRSDYLLAALDRDNMDYPENDISILMYLPKYGTTPMDRFYIDNVGFQSYHPEELFGDHSWRLHTAASSLHHEFQIWAEAADKLGSKLVLTLGGIGEEVTTKHFEGHPAFKTLIDSEQNQRKKGVSDRHNMGVLARTETIKELAAFTDPNSEIGAALARALD